MASSNVRLFQKNGSLFDSILVPTDGSALSIAAALKAVVFAKRVDARMVIYHSIPAYQYPVYVGGMPYEYPSEAEYETQCKSVADRYLTLIADAAAAQGVTVVKRMEFNGNPAQAIVEMAKREGCSLIFMGSHGRSGLSRIFLGNIAFKTLTLAHMPVLVDRCTPDEISQAEELMLSSAIEP